MKWSDSQDSMSELTPKDTKSLTLLCRLGFHDWPEWTTDMEQTDTPDGFLDGKKYWSSCRVCRRCYQVDLKQGIEYER